MTRKVSIYICIGCFILTLISGCKKEVQVGPPATQLVTTSVFADNTTATSAALSIYAQMTNFPWNLHRVTALSSDELTNYATDQGSKDLYINGLVTDDAATIQIWSPSYTCIYQANAILENLKNSPNLSAKVKQQLTGESLFMRAYFFFYLVNLYGDVPLATSTDYKINGTLARTPGVQVYKQIINDLVKAQGTLSDNYVDATDTAITADRIRPTSWAAAALLSRTYLYAGIYDSAELKATAVINNSLFKLSADLSQIFKKNSSEAIWQIPPSSDVFWTLDGANFILSAPPSAGTINSTSISTTLLNSFETGDNRKTAWISSYSSGGNTWFYPSKYKDNNTVTKVSEYTMLLRLAEQFLIRAEARTQQGNLSGAIADINVIRNRAGLGNYSGQQDKESLLAAVAHERRIELFTEGDRWIDLKRTKNVDIVMGSGGACVAKGGTWNTNQQFYPLQRQDILNNSNLQQNSGYTF